MWGVGTWTWSNYYKMSCHRFYLHDHDNLYRALHHRVPSLLQAVPQLVRQQVHPPHPRPLHPLQHPQVFRASGAVSRHNESSLSDVMIHFPSGDPAERYKIRLWEAVKLAARYLADTLPALAEQNSTDSDIPAYVVGPTNLRWANFRTFIYLR